MTTKQKQTTQTERTTSVTALPDALPRRNDNVTEERWRVSDAPPLRSAARTDMAKRTMSVTDEMGYTAAAIRAHELTRAAFSPTAPLSQCAQVFGVTPEALEAAEEWRLIALAQFAGVSMAHLVDGTEKSEARLAALKKDWRAAILLTVRTWGTDAERAVKSTLSKDAPKEWAKPLTKFRRTLRGFGKSPYYMRSMETLNYQDSDGNPVVMPRGFYEAASVAHLVDRTTKPGADPTISPAQRAQAARAQKETERHNATEKALRKFRTLPEYSKTGSRYQDVRLMESKLEEAQTGKIATKRTAANVGKKPRRLSRALTDPQRRVFDKRTRTNGGVVVVDMSGSMRLSTDDVDAILKAAGGATVLGYSNVGSHRANVWLIAHNGHRATVYPEYGANNDVDAPALRYAASLRKNRHDPFIWVSDGRAYHDGNSFTRASAREIDDLVRKHGIHNAPDAEAAVRELQRCARGNRTYTKQSAFITDRLRETD